MSDVERLVACAIQRAGVWHHGCQSHWELRMALDPANPEEHPSDVTGFFTSTGRHVTRPEGRDVALACGQLPERWQGMPVRRVLSSDINWNEGVR